MAAERVTHRWLPGLLMLALGSSMLGGCRVSGPGGLAEMTRQSFTDDMSLSVKSELTRLQEFPYAQLYARFSDREETVFLLAEQKLVQGQDLWVGSSGVSLAMVGPYISYTSGLANDIEASEPLRKGAVARYLDGQLDDLMIGEPSVLWLKPSDSSEWLEQIGTVERVQEVYYQGFAYKGPALRVTERVRTTGRSGDFRREFWIESRSRTLLRMKTRIWPDGRPIILEWIRVPDRADVN